MAQDNVRFWLEMAAMHMLNASRGVKVNGDPIVSECYELNEAAKAASAARGIAIKEGASKETVNKCLNVTRKAKAAIRKIDPKYFG